MGKVWFNYAMVTQQLLDYIRQQQGFGTPREAILRTLVAKGWSEKDVNEAFAALRGAPMGASSVPARARKSSKGLLVLVLILLLGAALAAAAYVEQPLVLSIIAQVQEKITTMRGETAPDNQLEATSTLTQPQTTPDLVPATTTPTMASSTATTTQATTSRAR